MDPQEQCSNLQVLQEERSESIDSQGPGLEQREGKEQGFIIDKFVMRGRRVKSKHDHSLMIY